MFVCTNHAPPGHCCCCWQCCTVRQPLRVLVVLLGLVLVGVAPAADGAAAPVDPAAVPNHSGVPFLFDPFGLNKGPVGCRPLPPHCRPIDFSLLLSSSVGGLLVAAVGPCFLGLRVVAADDGGPVHRHDVDHCCCGCGCCGCCCCC